MIDTKKVAAALSNPRVTRGEMNQKDFWAQFGVTQSGGSRYETGRKMSKPLKALMAIFICGGEQAVTDAVAAVSIKKK